MGVNELWFCIVLAFSVAAWVFWKKKIAPSGAARGYLMWLFFCNAISFLVFNPWGILR